MSPAAIYNILGGADIIPEPVRTFADLIRLQEIGIPKASVNCFIIKILSDVGQPSKQQISHIRRNLISDATFRRGDVFKKATAARIILAANLFAKAKAVIGTEEGAGEFMKRPHPELGGVSPIELARYEVGVKAADGILERAAHGVPV